MGPGIRRDDNGEFLAPPRISFFVVAELEYLVGSHAASSALAENYVGLPF